MEKRLFFSDGVRDRSWDDTEYLCWTRMQAEAGQRLETIIARKEIERQAGEGLFLWGVGSAPSRAIRPLAQLKRRIPVVFSVMRSKPRAIDASPARVVIWRRYIDKDGAVRTLPSHCIITSRGDSAKGPKRSHFALMCWSEAPLNLRSGVGFDPANYRNASGAGAPVGASQVTALLRRTVPSGKPSAYEANMAAELAESYWVRLIDPKELSVGAQRALTTAEHLSNDEWRGLACDLRRDPRVFAHSSAMPALV